MGEYFTRFDFSQIADQPHCLPDKAVEKLPMYTGTDAITSAMHLRNFSRCINAYVNDPVSQHDDMYMSYLLYLWMERPVTGIAIYQTMLLIV